MGRRLADGTWQDSCLAKVRPEEPIFVLRSQDKTAPVAVRNWAREARRAGMNQAKFDEAMETARAMEDWATVHGSKIPD